MSKLILNKKEYKLLEELIDKTQVQVIAKGENEFEIILSDEMASILSEKVQDAYVYHGFDKNYDLTGKGKLFEGIIDKFYTLGW